MIVVDASVFVLGPLLKRRGQEYLRRSGLVHCCGRVRDEIPALLLHCTVVLQTVPYYNTVREVVSSSTVCKNVCDCCFEFLRPST